MELSSTLIYKLDNNEINFKSLNGLYPGINENHPLFKRLNRVSLENHFTPNDFNSLLSACLKLEEKLFFYKELRSQNYEIDSLLTTQAQLYDQYLHTRDSELKLTLNILLSLSKRLIEFYKESFEDNEYQKMVENSNKINELPLDKNIDNINSLHKDYIKKIKKNIIFLHKYLSNLKSIYNLIFLPNCVLLKIIAKQLEKRINFEFKLIELKYEFMIKKLNVVIKELKDISIN